MIFSRRMVGLAIISLLALSVMGEAFARPLHHHRRHHPYHHHYDRR